MKPLVYIAGPYTSDPVAGTRAAIEAGMDLWAMGAAVIIPHLSLLADLVSPLPRQDWYRFDLDLLAHCHAVYVLPGHSEGVELELAEARRHGLPILHTRRSLLGWLLETRQPPPAARGAIHQPPGKAERLPRRPTDPSTNRRVKRSGEATR